MDDLTNKRTASFDYISRYASTPYYFNTRTQRDIMGLSHNLIRTTAYVSHVVKQEDTLASLALKYYNNPSYWWVIANFNRITDPFIKLSKFYKTLSIPSISSISFGVLR